MPTPYISPRFAAVDSFGNPLVGGRLYTYANNTVTPQTTYQDAAGTIANTNPIILDARGEAVVFLTEGVVYTWVLKDSNDALIWSQSDIVGGGNADSTVQVYPTAPASDVGSPIYISGIGWANWNGNAYVSDYSTGFGGGAYSWKNLLVNGSFLVWQSGTSIGPITSASNNPYTADQWRVHAEGTASVTVAQQSAGSDFGQDRVGAFTARITSNAASTPAAGNKNRFSQPIEGRNLLALALGSLWGGYCTVSVWVKASIVGTYSMAFLNGGSPSFRSYVKNFSIAVAGAWERKTLTIPVDQGGVANWNRSNGIGMQLVFDLGSGANYEGAVDTWLSTETTRSAGSVRTVSTSGATLEFGNVQLEAGQQATPFENRPIAIELSMCQEYYRTSGGNISHTNPGNNATVSQNLTLTLSPPMRAAPTVGTAVVNGTVVVSSPATQFVIFNFPNGGSVNNVWSWIADARL
ncbi:hypothetical protein D3C71_351560 [compost metagenome]